MTVKIINETPSPEVIIRTTCYKCGVTLEYVPNDVRTETRRDYTGCADTYKYIDCPKCSKSILVG